LAEADAVRAKAAALLGCDKDEIALTRNTTEGMNAVAQGIDWRRGDRVLSTDHEHEGGSVCWKHFARRCGIEIDRVKLPVPPQSPAEVLTLFERAITGRTRVISLSHVTFSTGLRLPVRQVADLARANGSLLVVDGAQSAGALDVNVRELGCDAFATSGHKWLLGPKGTGILYIRKASWPKIQPLLLDQGFGAYTTSAGTGNMIGMIGLGAAMDFLATVRKHDARSRTMELAAGLYADLKTLCRGGVQIASPAPGELSSPLVSLALPEKVDSAALANQLRQKHRIVVKLLPRNVLNGLRFSCHVYNSSQDCQRLVAALRQELV